MPPTFAEASSFAEAMDDRTAGKPVEVIGNISTSYRLSRFFLQKVVIKPENKEELFSKVEGKSKQEVQSIVFLFTTEGTALCMELCSIQRHRDSNPCVPLCTLW